MQMVRGFERRTVQPFSTSHVEISFIDGRHLDLWRERAENLIDLLGTFAVTLRMPVDEDGMRTLLGCSAKRHCGVNSEPACFVRRRGNDTALVALSADNDCLPF